METAAETVGLFLVRYIQHLLLSTEKKSKGFNFNIIFFLGETGLQGSGMHFSLLDDHFIV